MKPENHATTAMRKNASVKIAVGMYCNQPVN
jgi:hypothetical protein